MITVIGVIGLFLSLVLFIVLSFKGWNIAVSSIAASTLLIITNMMDPVKVFSETFADGFGNFVSAWWLMFGLGAIYGKAMKDSGMSAVLARLLSKKTNGNAVLMVLIVSLIMSYGGISTFVIAFTIYPIAADLFHRNGIHSSILPAAILFCPTTLSMTMLPGSPAIQNIIPTKYLDTDIYSSPWLGIIAALITFLLGSVYLCSMASKKKIIEKNESEISIPTVFYPDWVSLIPCVSLWVVPFILIKLGLESQISVEVSMVIAIIICLSVNAKNCNIQEILNMGLVNGLETLALTSCIMGYGAVVKSSSVFYLLISKLLCIVDEPVISSILAINFIATITGSSTSSLQLYFETIYDQMTISVLTKPQLHRIIAIASGGLDSMPYATGVAVTNDLARTKLKDTYWHIFITCAVFPIVSLCITVLIAYINR